MRIIAKMRNTYSPYWNNLNVFSHKNSPVFLQSICFRLQLAAIERGPIALFNCHSATIEGKY